MKIDFGDAGFAREFHKWAAIVWFIISIPICIISVFPQVEKYLLPFLVFVSVYAIVVGHWSSFQASEADLEVKKARGGD
jgi:hypothetical protein